MSHPVVPQESGKSQTPGKSHVPSATPHVSGAHPSHMLWVLDNDEQNTNLGQVSGSPRPHLTRLLPGLLNIITNIYQDPTQKKSQVINILEQWKMRRWKNLHHSQQRLDRPSQSSTSFPPRQLPAASGPACLPQQRETELGSSARRTPRLRLRPSGRQATGGSGSFTASPKRAAVGWARLSGLKVYHHILVATTEGVFFVWFGFLFF